MAIALVFLSVSTYFVCVSKVTPDKDATSLVSDMESFDDHSGRIIFRLDVLVPFSTSTLLVVEVCSNDFLFPFPLVIPIPTHSHSNTAFPFPFFPITSIPIPVHFGQRLYIDYLKAEKYVYCVVNSKQNMNLQQKHCNQTHHSSVIITTIITITTNHCSLFTVQRLWEFYFSPIKHTVPIPIRTIPIPIPISSPKLLRFPWESHGNGNSHSHAHL